MDERVMPYVKCYDPIVEGAFQREISKDWPLMLMLKTMPSLAGVQISETPWPDLPILERITEEMPP
jgi:hypothetical protein